MEANFKKEVFIIKNVIFDQLKDRRGKHIDYVASLPGFKKIILNPERMFVEIGKIYDVRVIKDTYPNDRERGFLIVDLLNESITRES